MNKKLLKKLNIIVIILFLLLNFLLIQSNFAFEAEKKKAEPTGSSTGTSTGGTGTEKKKVETPADHYDTSIVLENAYEAGRFFIEEGNEIQIKLTDIEGIRDDIFSVLFYIGVLASMIIIAILGIQFMVSAPEAKADVKKNLIIFVVGAVVVFGSVTIWKVAVDLIQKVAA